MAKRTNREKKESPRYVHTGHEDIPDSYTEITGPEYKALLSVNSTDARWIYFVLSFHRDFETGIAGLNPRISSGMLRKTISHKSDVGCKERKVSNNHIQRWIDQLEKAGLIQDRGNHVFYLPLARKHPRKENKSNTFGNTLNVTVTKGVTESLKQTHEYPINTEQNENKEVLQNVLQKPILSQKNERGLSQSLLPIQNNNLTKLNYTALSPKLSFEEQQFINLFHKYRLRVNLANPEHDALITVKALLHQRVTPEEAEQALISKLGAYKGNNAPSPKYFKDAILDYKRDLDAIKQQPEATHAKQKPPINTNANSNRYPESSTKRFWKKQTAILKKFSDED